MVKLKINGEVSEFKNWTEVHGEFADYVGGRCLVSDAHCRSDCIDCDCGCISECAKEWLNAKNYTWEIVS